jgi:lipopolysaccharide biosynthesis regulator YciM
MENIIEIKDLVTKEYSNRPKYYCLLDKFELKKYGYFYECPWCKSKYYLADWKGNKEVRLIK